MKIPMIVIGVLVAILGIAAVSGKLSFTQNQEVAKVGGLSASVEKQQGFPEWLGITAIALGGILVLGGAVKKG